VEGFCGAAALTSVRHLPIPTRGSNSTCTAMQARELQTNFLKEVYRADYDCRRADAKLSCAMHSCFDSMSKGCRVERGKACYTTDAIHIHSYPCKCAAIESIQCVP
jgi:hypothetical protein